MITAPIQSFTGEHSYLSNMYKTYVCSKEHSDKLFISVENAYQASKNLDTGWVLFCEGCTPQESKSHSKSIPLRYDWEKVKIEIMFNLVESKFERNLELRQKLLSTQNRLIIEGNNWNDIFWGVDSKSMKGANVLGQILMLVRERFKVKAELPQVLDLSEGQVISILKKDSLISTSQYPLGDYTVETEGKMITRMYTDKYKIDMFNTNLQKGFEKGLVIPTIVKEKLEKELSIVNIDTMIKSFL